MAIISVKNKRENLVNCDKRHLTNMYNNPNLFQTMLFSNIGCDRVETPVIPTTMVEETKMPKASYTQLDDDEVTDDNDEDEGSTPPSTPCRMLKIQSVLDHDQARKITHKPLNEVRVFNLEVDVPENESESDEQEHELETKEKEQLNDDESKDEIKEDSDENDNDENLTVEEVDTSD